MSGELTPSGRTVDTFAYDHTTAASYANMANGRTRYTVEGVTAEDDARCTPITPKVFTLVTIGMKRQMMKAFGIATLPRESGVSRTATKMWCSTRSDMDLVIQPSIGV